MLAFCDFALCERIALTFLDFCEIEYGLARGLFKGLAYRIVLIATTFFLVNKFKDGLAPMMFPAKMEKKPETTTH